MKYTFSCNGCSESLTLEWSAVTWSQARTEVDEWRKAFSEMHINHQRGA